MINSLALKTQGFCCECLCTRWFVFYPLSGTHRGAGGGAGSWTSHESQGTRTACITALPSSFIFESLFQSKRDTYLTTTHMNSSKNTQTCDIMLQLESQVVFLLGREAESRAVTRSGGPQWQTGRSGRSQRHRESCSESKARSLDSCVLNSFKIKQPQT